MIIFTANWNKFRRPITVSRFCKFVNYPLSGENQSIWFCPKIYDFLFSPFRSVSLSWSSYPSRPLTSSTFLTILPYTTNNCFLSCHLDTCYLQHCTKLLRLSIYIYIWLVNTPAIFQLIYTHGFNVGLWRPSICPTSSRRRHSERAVGDRGRAAMVHRQASKACEEGAP